MSDQNYKQQAERLRALWKSGRDKYASFFSVLNEVRQGLGDDALPAWCFDELRIAVPVIVEARRLLTAMDADIVKADLAAAKRAEKEQREAETLARQAAREEAQRRREEERRTRELEQAEHEKKLASIKEETDKVEHRKTTRERKRAIPEKEKADAAKRRALNDIVNVEDFAELVKRYKVGEKMCLDSDRAWVQGSVIRGMTLLQMRKAHPADRDFGEALVSSGIDLNKDDRAALLGLAALGEQEMRRAFANSDSRSYQVVLREHKKPVLKIVENPTKSVS